MTSIQFPDTWLELERQLTPLTSKVPVSDLARELVRDFDYQTDGATSFLPYELPALPSDFGIGVIVGASGTGKTTLLRAFGEPSKPVWTDAAICDAFASADDARAKLFAVGLTSVPTWMKPYSVLSNGEKFRADLAASLHDDAVIDEYTSVVDRNIAKAASKSLRKYVNQYGLKRLVIVTCHRDIVPFLEPDWIIDTDAGAYALEPKECLRREPMVAEVFEVGSAMWKFYAGHHYLTADISPFARCWIAVIDGNPVAFESAITYPSGTVLNAYREHRLVTHPDYQGLGIGVRFSDFVAAGFVREGKRFFGKTAHPRLGEWRERSLDWKPTSKNKKYRKDVAPTDRVERFATWTLNPNRLTYSHEFVGNVFDISKTP